MLTGDINLCVRGSPSHLSSASVTNGSLTGEFSTSVISLTLVIADVSGQVIIRRNEMARTTSPLRRIVFSVNLNRHCPVSFHTPPFRLNNRPSKASLLQQTTYVTTLLIVQLVVDCESCSSSTSWSFLLLDSRGTKQSIPILYCSFLICTFFFETP